MPTLSDAAKKAALTAALALVDGGKAIAYTGAKPAAPTDAATGTKLVESALADPAFGAPSGGVATANAIAAATAIANGVAGYVRLTQDDGTTGVIDLDAGGSLVVTCDDNAGTLRFTTTLAHGFVADTELIAFVGSGGVLPANVPALTSLFVRNPTATTFEVSLSAGGASIAYTDAGTAPIRVREAAVEAAFSSSDGTISAGNTVSIAGLAFRM